MKTYFLQDDVKRWRIRFRECLLNMIFDFDRDCKGRVGHEKEMRALQKAAVEWTTVATQEYFRPGGARVG